MSNGKLKMKSLFLVMVSLTWLAVPAWADFNAAYDRGDYAIALLEAKPLAEKGDAVAQSKLGVMYYLGLGTPKDYKKAAQWLLPSAEKSGDVYAIFALATMYFKGDGVPKDEKEAVRLSDLLTAKLDPTGAIGKEWVQQLRLGAEKGSAFAQYALGVAYAEGKDVPQDSNEAVRWFQLAADQGWAPAQHSLGVLYHKGEGVRQDYKEAIRWFRLAADQGQIEAQVLLGTSYALGDSGVPQDYVQAHMWLNLAAAQGAKDASRARDRLAKEMTPAQIAEAQKLAREWKPKKK
jgi:TPR repeat protein